MNTRFGKTASFITFALATCFMVPTLHAQPTRQARSFGAENVLLVVNEDSQESLAVANHYQTLRRIPANNVVYLKGPTFSKDGESTSSKRLGSEILKPINRHIVERGLQEEIDCITFSCGFPTRVNCNPELQAYLSAKNAKYTIRFHAPFLSLSSAVFYGDHIYVKEPFFLDGHANYYASRKNPVETRSFRSNLGWEADGSVSELGTRYRLATMLTVVRDNGSNLQQALDQLTRSGQADGTLSVDAKNDWVEKGVFYFADHKDPRSRTRKNQIPAAAQAIQELGYQAMVGNDPTPKSELILGATLGSAKHDWPKSKSTFASGALCDNFTSYGAFWAKGQTKVTHYLNNGAAGATGMVYEPYTIPYKVPTAFAQVHYARGSTLAEAVYQTVLNPFQMLFVADPLCRPFADLPEFTVNGISDKLSIDPDQTELQFSATPKPSGPSISIFEIYLNGQFLQNTMPDETTTLKLSDLDLGYHELRIVAVADHVASARTSQTFEIFVRPANSGFLKLVIPDQTPTLGTSFSVQCKNPGNNAKLYCNGRMLGQFSSTNKSIEIDSNKLGMGQVKLYATTLVDDRILTSVPKLVQIASSEK